MSEIRAISPALQAIAISELNEVPERIADDLQRLKDWLKKQPHIHARNDDQWLLIFLRGCKFSLEKAKLKLNEFYFRRTTMSEVFSNRDPFIPEIQRLLKLGLYLPLINKNDPNSPIIFLTRTCVYDTSIDKFEHIVKYMYMLVDILMNENDGYVIAGHIVAVDKKNVNLSHYLVPLTLLEKCISLYQTTYPLRIKRVCFFNTTSLFSVCMNMIKPFLSEKIKKRVRNYTEHNIKDFYKEVPQNLLPNEYGGNAGPLQEIIDTWKEKIESYSDWFKEDEKYINESSKTEKLNSDQFSAFGVEGSFRKMNFD